MLTASFDKISKNLPKKYKEIKDKYDFIFIDCPPTMYFFTKSALIASDAYLVPIKPDHLSSFGFIILEKAIEQVSYDYDVSLVKIGLIFTLVRGRLTKLMKTTMSNIRKLPNIYVFNNVITDLTCVGEASKENKTVFEFSDAVQSANEFKKLCEELIQRLKVVEND